MVILYYNFWVDVAPLSYSQQLVLASQFLFLHEVWHCILVAACMKVILRVIVKAADVNNIYWWNLSHP